MNESQNIADVRPAFKVTRGWLLRVLGSVLFLGGLLWYLPLEDVARGFSNMDWRVFFGVLLLFMLGHAVAAGKWWFLMGRCFEYASALRAHFAGLAANLCLPGVAGGDVVRAGLVSQFVELSRLTAASLSDRLIDMLALALVSVSGLLMLNSAGANGILVLQIVGLFVAALVGVFYVFPRVVPAVYSAIPKLPAKGFALKISNEFAALGRQPINLLVALVLSVAIQAAFVCLFIWLADVAGVEAPRGAWFFAWPLAKILAILPISLGGIGLREATLAGLMSGFGAQAAPVVAASLIWQAVLMIAGLIGAIAWIMTKSGSSKSIKLGERKEV